MFDCSNPVTLCHENHLNCGCVIDTSPEKLETEFHQWLKSAPDSIEGLCRQSDAYAPPTCFMPGYQNSFYVPQTIVNEEYKPFLGQYEMNSNTRIPFNNDMLQPHMMSETQLPCTEYPVKKFQHSPELSYNKTTECMVGSNVPGSSYPIEVTAKKNFKKRNGNMKCSKGMGTNLYGRFYCPGRPLDMSVREEIIRLFQQNMKVNQISKILKISHGCVSKIIKRFKLTGNVSPASSPEQRRPRRTKKLMLSNIVDAPKVLTSDDSSEGSLKSPPYQQQYPLRKSYSFQ